MISAINYGKGAESGKSTHSGSSQTVKPSSSDFIADVELAVIRSLNHSEWEYFVAIYKPVPVRTPVGVPSNVVESKPDKELFNTASRKQVHPEYVIGKGQYSVQVVGDPKDRVWEYRSDNLEELSAMLAKREQERKLLTRMKAQQKADEEHETVPILFTEYIPRVIVEVNNPELRKSYIQSLPEEDQDRTLGSDEVVRIKIGTELLKSKVHPLNEYLASVDVRAPRAKKHRLSHLY
jgi:hypothetical protein